MRSSLLLVLLQLFSTLALANSDIPVATTTVANPETGERATLTTAKMSDQQMFEFLRQWNPPDQRNTPTIIQVRQSEYTPEFQEKINEATAHLENKASVMVIVVPDSLMQKVVRRAKKIISAENVFSAVATGAIAYNWFVKSGASLTQATLGFLFQSAWKVAVMKFAVAEKLNNLANKKLTNIESEFIRRFAANLGVHAIRVTVFSVILSYDQVSRMISDSGWKSLVAPEFLLAFSSAWLFKTVVSAFGAGLTQMGLARMTDSRRKRHIDPKSKTAVWLRNISALTTGALAPFVMMFGIEAADGSTTWSLIQNFELLNARVIGLMGYGVTGLAGLIAYWKGVEIVNWTNNRFKLIKEHSRLLTEITRRRFQKSTKTELNSNAMRCLQAIPR